MTPADRSAPTGEPEITREEWRAVPGWPTYLVSSFGRVEGPRKMLSLGRDRKGYPEASLFDGERAVRKKVHALVLEAFVGPRPPGHQANHKNGVKHDNRPENLEWVTPSENTRHAYDVLGVKAARGSRAAGARLTDEQVAEMRTLYSSGRETFKSLGRQFGVSPQAAHRAVVGVSWGHLENVQVAATRHGERNPRAKLTSEQVAAIRARHGAGGVSLTALAKEYGVHLSTVSGIVSGKKWPAPARPGPLPDRRRDATWNGLE